MEDKYLTPEDAEAILRRAAEHAPIAGDLTRQRLAQMAAEMGIPEDALRKAEEDWRAQKVEVRRREARLEKERRAFRSHLWSYGIIIGFLFILNLLTSPGYLWAIFPALGWGLGLAFHAARLYGGIESEETQHWDWHVEQRLEALEEDRRRSISSPRL